MLQHILQLVLHTPLHIQQWEQPIQWQQGKEKQHRRQEQGRLAAQGTQGGILGERRVVEEGIPFVGDSRFEGRIGPGEGIGVSVGTVVDMVAGVLHAQSQGDIVDSFRGTQTFIVQRL